MAQEGSGPLSKRGPSWLSCPYVSSCCRTEFFGECWEWGSQVGHVELGLDGRGESIVLPGLFPWALSQCRAGVCASLGDSGCTQGLKDAAEEMWPLTCFTHTRQHFTSASTWSRVSVTKNNLCSGLSVSRGQLNKRDLSSLKTKKDK